MTATAAFHAEAVQGVNDKLTGLARRDSMFAVCASTVLLGVLFGLPAPAVDIMLIFSVCLAGGLVLIALGARRTDEITSFPNLVIGATCLHLATTVAAVRRAVLNDEQTSRIAAKLGAQLGDLSSFVCAVVFLCVAGVGLVAILAAVRFIRTRAVLNLAMLNSSRDPGDAETSTQANFNLAMGWAAKYMVLDAATSLVLLCVAVAGSGTIGAMKTLAADEAELSQVAVAVGAGIGTLIPAIMLAAAAAGLMSKDIVACKVASPGSDARNSVRAQRASSTPSAVKEAIFDEPNSVKAEREYQRIADMLLAGEAKGVKVILMAARNSTELGVTLPVNVAAKVTQKKHRCLIVDMDVSRDAVARAFDIRGREGPIKTCIRGLYAWGALSFCNGAASLGKKLEVARKHFDKIIVYWPRAGQGNEEIVQSVGAAMLCGKRGGEMAVLEARLAKSGCIVMQ